MTESHLHLKYFVREGLKIYQDEFRKTKIDWYEEGSLDTALSFPQGLSI